MDLKQALQIIERGTAEIIGLDGIKTKLQDSMKSGHPLRIKAGFDPTAPDIHLGHAVLLRKLRHFQNLGHTVYFLIGDFTALVGDPTGRNQLRPQIDPEYILENAKTYESQAFKILLPEKTKVVYNSHWLSRMSATQMLSLTAFSTVAQMLARSDFKKRFEDKIEISIMEFVYPLLQGLDSYALQADVELGGTDQKFNLLMGRQLQECLFENDTYKQLMKECMGPNFEPSKIPQGVVMTPLLEGTDGVQKMSKSIGNYIGINESPDDIFGKVMSISDELMMKYYEFLTDENIEDVKKLHPKEAKMNLGGNLVEQFHSKEAADNAKDNFQKIFSKGQDPENVEEFKIAGSGVVHLLDMLAKNGLVSSKKEGRRLLQQGAISFEGNKLGDEQWELQPGMIKVGKRRFIRLI